MQGYLSPPTAIIPECAEATSSYTICQAPRYLQGANEIGLLNILDTGSYQAHHTIGREEGREEKGEDQKQERREIVGRECRGEGWRKGGREKGGREESWTEVTVNSESGE